MNATKMSLNLRILAELAAMLRSFPFDAKRIKACQFRKLKPLLIYSYESFPFYRERMQAADFNPYEFRSLEELAKIPILTKDDYRSFTDSELDSNPEKYANYYRDATSGSTGTPLRVVRTWDERAYMIAKYLRAMFLNGYRITDKTFCLPSPQRIPSKDSWLQKIGFLRRVCIPYTAQVEEMMAKYCEVNPDYLYANKSQLVEMARHVKQQRMKIKQPRLCLSAAETMDENSKRLIEEVFGSESLFQIYGSVEFNNLAFQLRGSAEFQFCHDTNVLELQSRDQNPDDGNCIVTDLRIRSFPLIRYRLGDWLETGTVDGLRVINRIRGRLDDWVTFSDGTRKPFHTFYEVMETRTDIHQFRIIQESYDLFRVLVVPSSEADHELTRKEVTKGLRERLRADVEYRIQFCDSIPPDPNGKLRMIISHVN